MKFKDYSLCVVTRKSNEMMIHNYIDDFVKCYVKFYGEKK